MSVSMYSLNPLAKVQSHYATAYDLSVNWSNNVIHCFRLATGNVGGRFTLPIFRIVTRAKL